MLPRHIGAACRYTRYAFEDSFQRNYYRYVYVDVTHRKNSHAIIITLRKNKLYTWYFLDHRMFAILQSSYNWLLSICIEYRASRASRLKQQTKTVSVETVKKPKHYKLRDSSL